MVVPHNGTPYAPRPPTPRSTHRAEMDPPPVAPPPPPAPAPLEPDLGVCYYESGRNWYEMTEAERSAVLQAVSEKNKALTAAWQRAVDTLPAVGPGRS